MEVVIIVIAIVYSIWSEVNKQKQEKNLDFDFSELSSIDDFLKKSNQENSLEPSQSLTSSSRQDKRSRRKQRKQPREETLSGSGMSFSEPENHDLSLSQQANHRDEMPALSAQQSSFQPSSSFATPGFHNQEPTSHLDLKIDRNNLVKAFIISEVMTRYDINRIYERIPGVRNDDE